MWQYFCLLVFFFNEWVLFPIYSMCTLCCSNRSQLPLACIAISVLLFIDLGPYFTHAQTETKYKTSGNKSNVMQFGSLIVCYGLTLTDQKFWSNLCARLWEQSQGAPKFRGQWCNQAAAEPRAIEVAVVPGVFLTSTSTFFFFLFSPRSASSAFHLSPSKAGWGCLKLRQQYYLFKDSLEVCHHFPLPLVSLQHS